LKGKKSVGFTTVFCFCALKSGLPITKMENVTESLSLSVTKLQNVTAG